MTSSAHLRTILVLTTSLLAAACGGDDDSGSDGSTGGGGGGKVSSETRDLFANTCGGCHTLSDAETNGTVGPNLDETSLDADGVADMIDEGPGAMPPGLLEGDDKAAVAEYVAGQAGN